MKKMSNLKLHNDFADSAIAKIVTFYHLNSSYNLDN